MSTANRYGVPAVVTPFMVLFTMYPKNDLLGKKFIKKYLFEKEFKCLVIKQCLNCFALGEFTYGKPQQYKPML